MAAEIKLLIDEDTHLALAGALRKRGHDAVHVREAHPATDAGGELRSAYAKL